jgi:hypothetical protein
MARIQIALVVASVLSSSGFRQRRAVQDAAVAKQVREEGLSANDTIFDSTCNSGDFSILHHLTKVLLNFAPGNLAVPIWGGASPPLYEYGNCTIQVDQADLSMTLGGMGDLKLEYDCAHKGTDTGVTCRKDTCWFGLRKCTYPMDTHVRFNTPFSMHMTLKANLNSCGLLGYQGGAVEVGLGASVQVTDLSMRSNDKYDCTGLVYTGFEGTPEVRGGDLSWSGLQCVIRGQDIPPAFQEHCTRLLNRLLNGAEEKMKRVLAVKLAEQRLSA